MTGLLLGSILGALFFTYKPLFKHLKASKYSPKDLFTLIKENEQVKKEFKDFSITQMEKVKAFLAKFSKEKQAQQEAKEHKEEPQEINQQPKPKE